MSTIYPLLLTRNDAIDPFAYPQTLRTRPENQLFRETTGAKLPLEMYRSKKGKRG
jgi:hypothetical protein